MTAGRVSRISSGRDGISIPKTMADCLDYDDPIEALNLIAEASAELATEKSLQLQKEITEFRLDLPEILTVLHPDHPVYTVTACADSISSSLTKIASGGSQASQEIRKLEQEKRDMEEHADAVEMALLLRKNSDRAAQSLQARAWQDTAEAVRPWLAWKDRGDTDPRVRMYAGEYSIQQLQSTYDNLKKTLLSHYETSVQNGDLQSLGQLTPILSIIQLEKEGLHLYLQFLESNLRTSMEDALKDEPRPANRKGQNAGPTPPFIPMARVFNAAVTALRHHLPMVSHCLYKAEGAAAVVQLVHVQVEEAVLPVVSRYQRDRQLGKVSRSAGQIYAALEDMFTGRGLVDETENSEDADCGFSSSIGSLVDVDAAMEEAAMCIQHAESYMRFMHHTCDEVNKARHIRHDQAQQQARMERERQEWTTGHRAPIIEEEPFKPMVILPASTPLMESMAELGGQYAAIERCLLLASMQRAFSSSDTADPRHYRSISLVSDSRFKIPDKAMQTVLVETCLYAARRGSQRAFATGHTGTASAMTNFCVDCLRDVLLEVLSRRAEDFGVSHLKPGDGLLAGSANLFNNASNLIRQGTHVGATAQPKDELQRREEGITRACAMFNDLEVATHHISQLEELLNGSINRGFPPDTHETEQLRMCVKSFGTLADSFRMASDSMMESLESVLKSRIRSIVADAVGSEGGTSTFMGASSVMGGGKGSDRDTVRMNYNLDEESYNLLQVSEGYIVRLCYLLDESLIPLKMHLAPRIWDNLLLSIIGTACKRLEASLRKCQFTTLGAITLDSDVRDLLHYTKERLNSADFSSNVAVTKACPALSRLLQIAKLLSVDDLDDVLDLISNSKRKGNWDLKLEDAKAFLCSRVEFEGSKVNELLRLPNDD